MPIFWRIVNDNVYSINEVIKLGFEKSQKLYIPDDYLDNQIFTVCRTCLGIGDWGVIAAMPRLLKEKYPNCRVQIPSEKLLEKLLKPFAHEWLKSWSNPYKTMEYIFANNPYVDGYVDEVEDEIFHDHYRIYDDMNPEVPLLEQILDFWQFTPEEYKDSSPELYFTDDEKKIGDKIIKENAPNGFGTLLISNRFELERDGDFIKTILNNNKIPYFYWVKDSSLLPIFDVDYIFDMKQLPIRIQMYIKTQAKLLVGNMSGADIMFPRYTDVYMSPRGEFGSNIVRGNLTIKLNN
jgi:hypothetical protein